MRQIILALALLVPAAALAQGTTPPPPADTAAPAATAKPAKKPKPAAAAAPAADSPMVGDKPLVQVGKKKAAKKDAAAPAASGKGQSVAQKLQACGDIDDATKERLICYDAIYKPEPKAKPAAAKGVNECRFLKEEDERLTCYNGFADKIPRLPR
jgi:hypothetical protein